MTPPSIKPQRKLIDFNELKKVLIIMAPLYIAYLMNSGMSIIDTIIAGSIDEKNLAGVAIGSSVCWPIFISLGASLTIVAPMISRLRGEGKQSRIGLLINNAKILSLILGFISCALIYLGTYIFPYVSETPETSRIATHYAYFMILGVPATIFMRVVCAHFEGHAQTRPAMVIAILALLINYPLNHAFAYGWGPLPALGGAGCGLATSILSWFSVLSMLLIMFMTRRHKKYAQELMSNRKADMKLCHHILRIGLPISVAIFCETTFFCAISLIIAPLGNIAISAQQVALNISMVFFTLPLTLGIAASIRASYHIGAKDATRFNNLVSTLIIIITILVCFCIALIIGLRYPILQLFTHSQQVIDIAQVLLILCAIYQIPDALQALFQGLLRGCHDTAILSRVNILTYWLIGFPLAYTLIRTDWLVPAMGPAGAWVSFIVALSLTCALLAVRFYHTRRKLFNLPNTDAEQRQTQD